MTPLQAGVAERAESVLSDTTPIPTFVQKVDGVHQHVDGTGITMMPQSPLGARNRLVVLVGMWGGARATAAGVSDSAGNQYSRLHSFRASDGTEMSVWTAVVLAGAGSRPQIAVRATAVAFFVGCTVLEYSNVSEAPDASVLEGFATATGTTGGEGRTVAPGTSLVAESDGLALGFYVDSGFAGTVCGAPGWSVRQNSSPASGMTMLVQDSVVAAGEAVQSAVTTGPDTVWLTGTFVLQAAPATVAAAPA